MAYQLPEIVVDNLLDVAQRSWSRALSTPFWALIKNAPEVRELLSALNQLQSEVSKCRENANSSSNSKN